MSAEDDALARIFSGARYRVRVPGRGSVPLRVQARLPQSLAAWLGAAAQPWSLVTAWNPGAARRPAADNRAAMRALRAALAQEGIALRLLPAQSGDGSGGWREAHLFVAGIARSRAVGLARRFGQRAVLYGIGGGRVRLAVLPVGRMDSMAAAPAQSPPR